MRIIVDKEGILFDDYEEMKNIQLEEVYQEMNLIRLEDLNVLPLEETSRNLD